MVRKLFTPAARARLKARLASNDGTILSVTRLHRSARPFNEASIRTMCDSVFLGDHLALCRVLGRYKMFVDSRDFGIAPHLMLDGYWEMWVTETLVALVEEGMVVADIGANLGYFTLLMADLVGPRGRVHAFEPNPRMTDLLCRSASVNGFLDRIEVHQVALGANDGGHVALMVPPEDPKNAHIVPLMDPMPANAVAVPLARLDGRPDWRAIELAKVDVEGAEQLVWAGANGLLDGGCLKTVILEFTAARYDDPREFLRALLAPGFKLFYIDSAHGVLPINQDDVLKRDPHVDIMLVLRR